MTHATSYHTQRQRERREVGVKFLATGSLVRKPEKDVQAGGKRREKIEDGGWR